MQLEKMKAELEKKVKQAEREKDELGGKVKNAEKEKMALGQKVKVSTQCGHNNESKLRSRMSQFCNVGLLFS